MSKPKRTPAPPTFPPPAHLLRRRRLVQQPQGACSGTRVAARSGPPGPTPCLVMPCMVSQPRAKRKWPRMPEPETKIDTKFVLGAGANHCRGRTYRDDYLDCNDVKCAQAARKGPAEAAAPAGTPDVRQKQQLSWLPRPLSISSAAVPKGQAVRPTWHPPAHPTTPEVHKKTKHFSRRRGHASYRCNCPSRSSTTHWVAPQQAFPSVASCVVCPIESMEFL